MAKNWKAISALSDDWFLKVALARADEESATGRALKEAFPTCFVEGENQGAIPWSILRHHTELNGAPGDREIAEIVLERFGVPHITYTTSEEAVSQLGFTPMLADLQEQARAFRDVVLVEGASFLVTRHWLIQGARRECLTLVPVECLDLNA